jgi:ATP synthase protein I
MAFLPPDQVRALGALSVVGFSFVLALVIGVAAGVWLDRHAGTSPWGVLGGFALGVAAGILNVYRATRQAMR